MLASSPAACIHDCDLRCHRAVRGREIGAGQPARLLGELRELVAKLEDAPAEHGGGEACMASGCVLGRAQHVRRTR